VGAVLAGADHAVDLYALLTPGWHAGIPADRSTYWARKYTRLVTMVSSATAPAPLFVISNDNLPSPRCWWWSS
jgi:hypothetical protein